LEALGRAGAVWTRKALDWRHLINGDGNPDEFARQCRDVGAFAVQIADLAHFSGGEPRALRPKVP
jgi:hypothetical protein